MLVDIIEVTPLTNYRLWLKFEDGTEGEISIADLISFTGVFAPLQDEMFFKQVRVEYGTVTWANGADLDPLVLYAHVTGKPVPDYTISNVQPR
jgi:hypothetical protein